MARQGHGSISLLFWDIDVDFDNTWGESADTDLPPIAVMPIVTGELAKPENWRALLPAGSNLLVSLRAMPEAEAALVLHPVGALHITPARGAARPQARQGRRAEARTTSNRLLDRRHRTAGWPRRATRSSSSRRPVPGLRRRRQALQARRSSRSGPGSSCRPPATTSARRGMVRRVVRYEEIIIDTNYKRFARRFRGFIGVLFDYFLNGARGRRSRAVAGRQLEAACRSTTTIERGRRELHRRRPSPTTRRSLPESATFHSEASAREYMNGQIAADPHWPTRST